MVKIKMLPLAAQDLEEIVDFLSGFYVSVALDQYDNLIEKINKLPSFPFLHPVYKPGKYNYEYRKMVVDNYLVFYVVLDDAIEIHRILHQKRNITYNLKQDE